MSDGVASDAVSAERIAHTDAAFRAANERIGDAARRYQIADRVPFLCECAEPRCREIVTLSLAEYAEVRSDGGQFLTVPGHELSAGPHARVIATRDSYVIVTKVGRAGEVARELDTRADG